MKLNHRDQNYLLLVSSALLNLCYFLVLSFTENFNRLNPEKAQERSIFEDRYQFVDKQDKFSLISSIERYILNEIDAYS